jgi:hypothetical protein
MGVGRGVLPLVPIVAQTGPFIEQFDDLNAAIYSTQVVSDNIMVGVR